ncbi:protein disulfide-isomerase TMX3-like [Oppia nitens]|uniref:protein disulfide-isomerase TMX3-like n=1 Tax=Oppia nitens TaxID=1686743 RepID=UPI0023D97CAF|nr:protein disulfide-isomerase TMX3-like [Oppia nitens]
MNAKQVFECLLWLCITQLVSIGSNRVIELNERFLEVLNREGEWRSFLVLFYAPWCYHCQQLEPVWGQVAQQIHNEDKEIYVGRVDCTKYTTLSTHFNIKGFPTILYINKDKRFEFRGERTKKEMIDFALRVNGPPVRHITDCSHIDALRQTHDVLFVNFDSTVNENYTKIATNYQSIDWFYYSSLKCNPFSDGIYSLKAKNYYKKFDENEAQLEEWIKLQRFAQFVRITNSNFNLLLQTRKYLVIALIEEYKSSNKVNPKHKWFYDLMESIAYSYPNINDLIIGWTPDVATINSIAIRTITPLPNIIVINSTTLQYYLIDGQLNSQNIISFLDNLTNDSSKINALGGDRFWHRIQRMAFDTITSFVSMYYGNPVLTILLFGVPGAFLSIIIYTTCCSDIFDAKDEDNDEDDDEHEKQE